MKSHYDFSNAVVGKHYYPLEELEFPIYLDNTVTVGLSQLSQQSGKEISILVNELLKKDLELISSVR